MFIAWVKSFFVHYLSTTLPVSQWRALVDSTGNISAVYRHGRASVVYSVADAGVCMRRVPTLTGHRCCQP